MHKQPLQRTAALSTRTNIMAPIHWAAFCVLWLKAAVREYSAAPECSMLKHCCDQVDAALQVAYEQLDAAAPDCRMVCDCMPGTHALLLSVVHSVRRLSCWLPCWLPSASSGHSLPPLSTLLSTLCLFWPPSASSGHLLPLLATLLSTLCLFWLCVALLASALQPHTHTLTHSLSLLLVVMM